MINWRFRCPAVPPPVSLGAGGGHSCSITRSWASSPPPYLPAPWGSPRLPAVGSGAGGEMEDGLGGEQGIKGPASSGVPPAQQGTAGAGGMGSRRAAVFLSSAVHLTRALRGAAGRSGGGWVERNDMGKRREGVFQRLDREK